MPMKHATIEILEEGETTQVIAWDDARNIYYIPLNEISNNLSE